MLRPGFSRLSPHLWGGGYSDELRLLLSTGTWGALTVFREKDRSYFSPSDVRLVASLTGMISDGLRRSLLLQHACADGDDTGMLVMDPGDGIDLANQAAERWLDELGAHGLPTRHIANQLRMSTYTVQDHLKSIFAKTGTGSRGALIARLFFDQRATPMTAPPVPPAELRATVTGRL